MPTGTFFLQNRQYPNLVLAVNETGDVTVEEKVGRGCDARYQLWHLTQKSGEIHTIHNKITGFDLDLDERWPGAIVKGGTGQPDWVVRLMETDFYALALLGLDSWMSCPTTAHEGSPVNVRPWEAKPHQYWALRTRNEDDEC